MPIGIAGDSLSSYSGTPSDTMTVVELRTLSNLMQALIGTQGIDELNVLRADQAFELKVQTPLPGNSR